MPSTGVSPPHPAVEAIDADTVGAVVSSRLPPALRVRTRHVDQAGEGILALVRSALEAGAREARAGMPLAELERMIGRAMVEIGQHVLAVAFATACREAMTRDVRDRGLEPEQVALRTDGEGYFTTHTTFGPITFPVFTYRDLSTPAASVTRSPAHALFPHHRACRSSPLCLEWEARLGLQHPFRRAEQMLHFFTRGAATVEDTTIARHMLALSRMVEPRWLYRTPEDIRRTLVEQATRDKITQRPLLYVSSDAHALRRYVDDTWALQWKMVNGIRVWCEDAKTGAIIHLGGEFTWGDCHEVSRRIQALVETGVLPNDDAAWAALEVQIVFTSDGSTWLLEHIVPHLVGAIVILDPYHLIDWFAQFTTLAFGAGTPRARAFHVELQRILFNKQPRAARAPSVRRRGHRKTRRGRTTHTYDRRWAQRGRPPTVSSEATARALMDLLATIKVTKPEHRSALEALVERVASNALRIDYAAHLTHGLQVGSGAMESMHRNGSQLRLKAPGARWLAETSQAVLHFRMLEMSGRWREFWDQPALVHHIAKAFTSAAQARKETTPEAA